MTTNLLLLTMRFTVGLPEIVIFQIGAIVLGFCIHLFIVSRRTTIEKTAEPVEDPNIWTEDWKMKYYSEMDQQELVQKNRPCKTAQTNGGTTLPPSVVQRDQMPKLLLPNAATHLIH